jgi:hypothetical protein
MIAIDVTAPDDEYRLAEPPEPSPEQHEEATRIAALPRDRFGTEY